MVNEQDFKSKLRKEIVEVFITGLCFALCIAILLTIIGLIVFTRVKDDLTREIWDSNKTFSWEVKTVVNAMERRNNETYVIMRSLMKSKAELSNPNGEAGDNSNVGLIVSTCEYYKTIEDDVALMSERLKVLSAIESMLEYEKERITTPVTLLKQGK